MNEIHLSSKDNNTVLQANVGTTIIITLGSNPTTGFAWAIANMDAAIIQNTQSQFKKGDSAAIGASSYQEFTFKVLQKGNGKIELKYFRHFEGDASITKRYQVTVNAV
jgi:inhibitor of cysteine peptidase